MSQLFGLGGQKADSLKMTLLMDMGLGELWELVKDREAWRAVDPDAGKD